MRVGSPSHREGGEDCRADDTTVERAAALAGEPTKHLLGRAAAAAKLADNGEGKDALDREELQKAKQPEDDDEASEARHVGKAHEGGRLNRPTGDVPHRLRVAVRDVAGLMHSSPFITIADAKKGRLRLRLFVMGVGVPGKALHGEALHTDAPV